MSMYDEFGPIDEIAYEIIEETIERAITEKAEICVSYGWFDAIGTFWYEDSQDYIAWDNTTIYSMDIEDEVDVRKDFYTRCAVMKDGNQILGISFSISHNDKNYVGVLVLNADYVTSERDVIKYVSDFKDRDIEEDFHVYIIDKKYVGDWIEYTGNIAGKFARRFVIDALYDEFTDMMTPFRYKIIDYWIEKDSKGINIDCYESLHEYKEETEGAIEPTISDIKYLA